MEAWQNTAVDYDEVLGTKITSLCGNIYAATYQLLKLIREFDERKAWADTGVYNCAHWLNFTCGIGMNSAREKVRVANALAGLPLISAAFERGEVSYSKVRAMTRVANTKTEEYLLMIAKHGTAAHVEKLVRQYKRVKDSQERDLAQQAFANRELKTFYDDTGMAGIIVRLPTEETAKTLAVINQIMVDGWKADRGSRDNAHIVENAGETGNQSDNPENETESNVSAETRSASALPTGSATQSESVTVGDVICNSDPVQGAKPIRDPINAQRADAFMTLIDAAGSGKLTLDPKPDRAQIIVHIDADALSGRDTQTDCHLEHGERICPDVARRLSCDSSVVKILEKNGEPLNIGRKTRSIPSGMRRALECRDRGCRFPGCNRYYNTDGHHIDHWGQGGETSLKNLVLLCRFHHRLVHEEGYTVVRKPGGKLIFCDPRGEVLRDYYETQADDLPFDYGIPAKACVPKWYGDVMDYGAATESLCDKDP